MHHTTKRCTLCLSIALILLLAPGLGAQQQTSPAESAARSIGAVRADVPPVVDGRLDDDAWAAAPVATGFIQRQPDPGAPASQETEARVLYDEDALYVAIRLLDERPSLIEAPLARRDASGISSEWVYVMLDSYHDRRTGFVFGVNPRGVQKDYMVYNDADEDTSWDPVWEVGTTIDDRGWTAEFRIPLSQLRFDPDRDTWGLNIQRRLARNEEWSFWSPWPPNSGGYVSEFGTLTGLAGLASVRGVELQPYASVQVTRAPGAAANPFHSRDELGATVGADLMVGLTSGLTLSATINPDFGQVEADPAEVNLTAFETAFSEKRPFFVERADVFRFGRVKSNVNVFGKEFFYSRRIGRAPQRTIRGEDILYVDAPSQSPILGAAKVTGKTGPWTVGILDAVTGEAEASFLRDDGTIVTEAVEPRTNYFASRARRDFRGGATILGSMVTATNRANADGPLADLLASGAYMGGLDFEHAWADRTWTLSGYAAATRVAGEPAAIERLQLSSSRYYQRPDAGHVELDPDRTSLEGHSASLALRRSGSWDMSLFYEHVSPGFEINDLGFQGRTDYRSAAAFLGRRVNQPVGPFRSFSAYTFAAGAWNFEGDPHVAFFGAGTNGSFRNLWSAGLEANVQPSVLDDRLTRGGPLARTPREWNVSGWFGTDSRRALSFEPNASASGDDEGGFSRSVGVNVDWRPSPAVRLQIEPSISRSHSARQYVGAVADPEATATFGHRYLFADLDRTTLAVTTRLDWTFTPRLSLQLYAQPFLAAGEFDRLKELRAPRSAAFDVYGRDRGTIAAADGVYTIDPDGAGPAAAFDVDDPSFNVRSLRGNAVLRWEYRPGSTLFLVWQQERSGFGPTGDFRFRRDAGELLDAPATNVLLIKATYWLGR